MVKKAALIYGVVFLLIGIAGFIPALTPDDDHSMPLLFGIFMVGVVHNIIHLGSGLAALFSAQKDEWARMYFQVFGLVYALVTIIGFVQGDTVLGLFHVNLADNLLHLFLAVTMLGIGFGAKDDDDVQPAIIG
ncbi:MAG TPA: DUF4383 domain-containing protein [Candidatus Saccharimonadales bacterium]|nr:DUF4383 domain-containing protein [Candidatus Saccharimonadales bacterium]